MSEQLLKVFSIALLATVSGIIIKQIKNELSFALKAAGGIIIFGITVLMLEPLVLKINELSSAMGNAEYFSIMLRSLGIALLCQITAGICRDCGEENTALGVEMASKAEILVLCLPLIEKILEYAKELAER